MFKRKRDCKGRWLGNPISDIKECTLCHKVKKIANFSKDSRNSSGYGSLCKQCKRINAKEWAQNNPYKRRLWKESHPWNRTLGMIKSRCNNPKCESFKRYGAIGIKCLIAAKELKQLWFRDNANLMKRPSIDRKNRKGNYTFDNCRYIELKENIRRVRCR